MTDSELQAEIAKHSWYHRIELRPGIITPGWAPHDPSMYRIPDDLTGKRVLDIGAWDGYWSFEAAKRGAESVEAIDDFSDTCGTLTNYDRSKEWSNFDLCDRALNFPAVHRKTLSVYDVESLKETFSTIFCFGVLYHLQDPFLALRRLRNVCTGTIYIETAVLDGSYSSGKASIKKEDGTVVEVQIKYDEILSQLPIGEFYEGSQYGNNDSNWHNYTLKGWSDMVKASGFKVADTWFMPNEPWTPVRARGFIKATV